MAREAAEPPERAVLGADRQSDLAAALADPDLRQVISAMSDSS